jgi:thiopeptide-type bacteriocin biosynthesis protein
MPRLPRVSYKHWIISKACWNLDKTVLEEFIETTAEPVAAWQKISRKLSIPRYFQIGEADHQLLIDAKSIPAMVLLKEFAKKNGRIILTEYLQGSRSWLRDQGQAIANEIIIPFKAASSQNRLGPSYRKQKATAQQNAGVDFSVGSQWLYVKIYCSQGNSDQILETYIAPLCNTLIESKQIEKWFFVRYQDPAPHLRIRFFHASSPDFWILVLSRLHQVMAHNLREQSVSKMQIETYQRELERYHMLDYDAVESLFFYDSIFVSHALPLLRQNIDPDTYWLAALRSADELFSALGLDLGSKIELVKKLHKTLAEELDTAEDLVVMDHNYRLEKTKISAVMSDSASLLSDDIGLSRLFEDRTKAFGLILQHHHKLDLPARQELTAHLIHMHLNRWFSAEQRRQELVIYHYLEKFYDSAWKYYQHLKISV